MDEDPSSPSEVNPNQVGDESMDVDVEELDGAPPDPDETEYSSRGPTPALIPPDLFSIPAPNSIIPPTTLIKAPDGTVIIEELDTPAIRREKNRREKARKLEEQQRRLAAPLSNDDLLPHPTVLSGPGIPGPAPFSRDTLDVSPRAGPSKSASKAERFEGDSDLSSLSEEGGNASKNHRVIGKGTKLEGGVLGSFVFSGYDIPSLNIFTLHSMGESW